MLSMEVAFDAGILVFSSDSVVVAPLCIQILPSATVTFIMVLLVVTRLVAFCFFPFSLCELLIGTIAV